MQEVEREEKFEFEAEVPQVMSLIINSVYSSKELFLRELISNASDALSKMMTQKEGFDKAGYTTDPFCSYRIQVIVDEENKTLTIKDNGVGMTKADLRVFLGSIASSGTKKFREAMESNGDKKNVDQLIGQFGLGFYSAFLVAERVDVITRSCKEGGHIWSSDGGVSYSIRPCEVEDAHGTSVILKLKEGEYDYLKADKLTELLKKHSMFIRYPIHLITEEVVTPAKKEEDEVEIDGEKEVEEIKEDEEADGKENEAPEESKPTKKLVDKVINVDIPVWTKKVEDIPEEDLKKFYKSISNDFNDYAVAQSWHFEGIMDLKILLFIPKRAKMNFFERKQGNKCTSIKVFNSNVFVTDELSQEIVPEWMQFVVGAVTSSDFPMNISREFLQGKGATNLLKNKLPKCIAEMIKKLEKNEEAFAEFYKEFSANIKMAVREYSGDQQETFAKFLRYTTNLDNEKAITFDEYIAMLPEDNKQILLLTGLNKKDVATSIYLDSYKDKPVLLMHEAVDEVMLQSFKSYKGYTLQMISAEGEGVTGTDDADYTALKDFIKEELKDKLEKVVSASRPDSVAATLYSSKYASSGTMESILKNQIGSENNPMIMMMLNSKKIMEINTASPVVKLIKEKHDAGEVDTVKKYAHFLYQVSMLGCGYPVEDKSKFVKDVYALLLDTVSHKAADTA
ncbi:molecular chaperone HtpG [Pancytospora epiphaga]|nr:molecular chaperone HtpG [Pancytospora epiphaga]